jgi:cellulose synthase/poly-beta-1,6-N-acetylglucosamine synthase-like glycosyltransferase
MTVGDGVLLGLAALASVPALVLALEVVAALWPRWPRVVDRSAPRPRAAILIPAHNEAAGIGKTLEALRPQLAPGDRLIVIADNCDDQTAARAREAGADAWERHDAERKGKGFALQFGLDRLKADPPDVVVLVDADTRAGMNAVEMLIREVQELQTPVQGVFVDAPATRGPREQWSAFALTFKNYARPLGLRHLGLPTLLFGSGMAFPWSALSKIDLGTGNIVEDMKLGIDLAIAGHPARFCPDARFESDDAPTLDATVKRRTRWEHGHVFTLLTQTPRLFAASITRCRPRLAALALELAVPPLSLLAMTQLVLWAVCAGWWWLGGSPLPVMVLTIALAVMIIAILLAWMKFGRNLLSLKILCLLPVYVLWKIPIYLKLVIAPQRRWVRTDRNPAS